MRVTTNVHTRVPADDVPVSINAKVFPDHNMFVVDVAIGHTEISFFFNEGDVSEEAALRFVNRLAGSAHVTLV